MRIDVSLLDALPDAVLLVREGSVAWANAAAARLLGAGRGRLEGRPLEALLAPGELSRLRVAEGQRAAGFELPATFRARFIRLDDGREVATGLRVARPDPAGGELLLSARDASELVAAEALMSALAELASSAEAMSDAVALVRAAGPLFEARGWVVALTEVRAGKATVRTVVGGPAGSPVYEYGRSLVGREAPLEAYPLVADVLRRGRPLFLDDVPAAKGGAPARATRLSESLERTRLRRSAWVPVPGVGPVAYVLSVAGACLTEPDFLAIQLFGAQVAAALRLAAMRGELVKHERLAALGEMSAVLAHEVRNPLGVIFNAVTGLSRQPACQAEGRELLAILREEAERLKRLMDDLLDYSRPWEPRLRELPLAPLAADALAAALAVDSGGARPQVQLDFPPSLPPALADPDLVRRALVNLLTNALQHVPPDGRVTVSARVDGARIRLRVSNDGPAIKPEVGARLFEPFFTTRATGTGLGLAVVRRVAESLGGSVEVSTEAPVTFSLLLPRAPG